MIPSEIPLFLALKGCMYMTGHQMALIFTQNTDHYVYLACGKFGVPQWNSERTAGG